MGETQNPSRDRKKKEFQVVRSFNGNLSVECYLEKIIKAHMEAYRANVRKGEWKEERKNGGSV